MRPLLRYTIGSVANVGFEILAESIKSVRAIYPQFDIIVAYNSLNKKQEEIVCSLGTEIYKQTGNELPLPPLGPAWKLYPPRFRLQVHEIVMDNDLILLKPMEEIDSFLNNPAAVMLSEDRYRLFGNMEEQVKPDVSYNSGLYGLPPYLDFEAMLKNALTEFGINSWKCEFDEQGLVAYLLLEQMTFITIPLTVLDIIEETFSGTFADTTLIKGMHFVGTNRDKDAAWKKFWKWRKSSIMV